MKITGTIADAASRALAGYRVVAYHGDVNLKKEKSLGADRTDKAGAFSLAIDAARYPLGVNVRLAILNGGTKELWSSPIHYNVKADLVIDATVPDANLGITEYRRLIDKISPLLQGARLAALPPAQIAYLTGRSEIGQTQLNQLVSAALLHDEIAEVSEEACYGLIRQGLPATIGALVALTGTDWKAALDAAVRGSVISPLSRVKESAIIAAITARKSAEALRPSSPIANGVASFATVALANAGKQKKIAVLVARHNGVNDAFWNAVKRDPSITASELKKFENYAAVSEIVGNDPELLRRIEAHLTRRGEKVAPAALATIKADALSKLIEAAARAKPDSVLNPLGAKEFKAYADATASAIAGQVAAAFPTEALRAELKAAPATQYFSRYRSGLQKFFDNNRGFDLRNGLYAALNPPPGSNPFRGIADKDDVKKRLSTIVRLSRVLPAVRTSESPVAYYAPTGAFSAIAALADKGYESSSAISAAPRARFLADVSTKPGDETYWSQVHDNATGMRDIAWLRGIELLQAYRQPFGSIRSLRDAPEQPGVADLRSLFGAIDMCDCEACASVTSPAAYLADILNFLGTEVATAQTSPLQILIERRPDIPHILLNCDNANRAMPYIDLVNELLEDEVLRASDIHPVWAPHKRVQFKMRAAVLDAAASERADEAISAKRTLIPVLNKELPGYGFDNDADVSVVGRNNNVGTRWHVFERGWLVELSQSINSKQQIKVDYTSRQTYGTSAELAANPAFRNARAARALDAAKFPPSLPPALPLRETRLFLDHLQVPRDRLIKLLAPLDGDGWAIEYLGLSASEADLIANPNAATPVEAWGFRAAIVEERDVWVDPADSTKLLTGQWSEKLRRVDVLIARAGISYIELLELLGTDFVNPPLGDGLRRVTIQSTDQSDPATCDLSKLELNGSIGSGGGFVLTTRFVPGQGNIGAQGDLLDRLLRFLRLKRRTGWAARELDLAIRQVRPGILDRTTLALLAALKWTKGALGLSHAEACALMGAIDTRRYIDHAAEGQPTLLSQYEQLFQNRAITNPVDRNFALDDTGDELRNTALSLTDGRATIAAAFQIGETEVTLLATKAGINTLSLQALSDIYRRVVLARGFKLRIQEMVWLEGLAGALPARDRIPAFVEQVRWLLSSKLSVIDSWFLLRGSEAATAHLAPRDDEIAQTLGELRSELQRIEAEHQPDPIDADGALLRRRLGELDWGAPLIDDLVGTITDSGLHSVPLTSLPTEVSKLLSPGPGDPVGVELASAGLVPDGVDDLVAYDTDNQRLRALRALTRSDRKRLLRAGGGPSFRKAVELLFALSKVTYDNDKETLTCRGLLPATSAVELAGVAQPRLYKDAVAELADQQQQLLRRKLRYCSLPVYEIDLNTTILDLPAQLAAYVYYDGERKKLVIRGQLTDAEQAALRQGATPPLSPAALQALPTAQNGGAAAVNLAELRELFTIQEVDELFDPPVAANMPVTTAEVAAALLAKLTPYAMVFLGSKAIVNSLSRTLGLDTAITRDLIERRLPSSDGTPRMVDAFLTLTTSDSRAPVDPTRYPALFDDYRRLNKIALLFQRLKLEAIQLPWVFEYASQGGWLSAANLTSGAATGGAGLAELSELVRLFTVAARSPYSVTLVDDLMRLAADQNNTLDDLFKFLRRHTTWSVEDLRQACQALSLSTPGDFVSAKALDDLSEALAATGKLGANVKQALQLAKLSLTDDDAMLAKSLAKSKHDSDRWLGIVKPINDTLREARRSALVDYLVAHPRRAVGSGWPLWHDANSLYDYLLVDVQMGACMTTSRIRLALSSAQLFVQRCLMNLEPPVSVSDDAQVRRHWDEWETWRKLYRVWEANRKVFLYPEDWIEPELRDDKTPFFKELENELLQNEVTKETAEAAFLHYLHKLDQVGKLEVMGIFVEDETQEPPTQVFADPRSRRAAIEKGKGTVPHGNAPRRTLHVVARTYGDPRQWFYRKLTTSGEWHTGIWSPWEKIEADITGDHVLPVVWNHHVYLFWALFEQKADKPTEQERKDKENPQEPRNRWYIKFAWSECRDGKWSPKRVSQQSLRTPAVESDERKITEDNFSFKTDIDDSGISIRCYGPNFDDPANAGDAGARKESTPKEGYLLTRRSANCSIRFQDRFRNWETGIDVLVYQGDRKVLTLDSKNNGYVEIWNQFGKAQWWRDSDVEIRTTQNLFLIEPLQQAPYDWRERSDGNIWHFDPLYAQVQVVNDLPVISTIKDGPRVAMPGSTLLPSASAMSRIGRFNYLVCRGDLRPVPEVLDEQIPGLEAGMPHQGTELQGMMYVAKSGEESFLRSTLQSSKGGRYRVLMPHQYLTPDTAQPFFFQDDSRVFLVTLPRGSRQSGVSPGGNVVALPRQYRFDVFYHPYVCDFIAAVNRKGVKELLTLQSQALNDNGTAFLSAYSPSSRAQVWDASPDGRDLLPITREDVNFERSGSYSVYNWELFFHAPFLIATKLNANQRFAEARQWLHFIFDPTTRPGTFRPGPSSKPTQRFWNVRPFWAAEGRDIYSIDSLLRGAEDLSEQYLEWREQPFKPFVVARLRQTAFMQSVVMRYLDNLIDWGDQQFSQFTMESTNEAGLLYALAAEILGKPPEKIPPRARPALQTYASMQQQASAGPGSPSSDAWRNFSDLMVAIEGFIAPAAAPGGVGTGSALGRMWAFCVPGNGNLLEYWTRVADRLFKLRHCQDIEGVERKIPLWDPPIDPALLVRAAAAGLDLTSVLSDINAALPNYRFSVMLQKAIELCNEVRNFGAALLSALEKKDGEDLARLRSKHEVDLLERVRAVKSNQLAESTELRVAAEKSKLTVEARRDHYRDIPFLIPAENTGLALTGLALTQETVAAGSDALAAIAAWVPQYSAGTSGVYSSPVVVAAYGGEQVSRSASAAASLARSTAAVLSNMSAVSHTFGGFLRRQDDWKLQETLANKELVQIQKQIDAATIREAIAQAELDNHVVQTGQAKDVADYLRSKYTNQELYAWMQGQLASLYFQTYKLAFDAAKKTERAFRHELGLKDSNFVQFGYWDNLKNGLLSGERLQNDLRRMEAAYLDQNRREFEITKHVSLAELNPAALIALTTVGECEVDIPESLFDMDYPGHYMRRIKSMSLSIPCVTGRHTSVNCTLTQSFSKIRKDTDATNYEAADHFHENFGAAQTVVTSTAREDSGLFELNFRDERYLPFEGTGAISRWRIKLPREANQFDVGTASDVIFHLRYTARDGGEALRESATTKMRAELRAGIRVFDAPADFGSDWYRFKNPEPGQDPELRLELVDEHFPFHPANYSISIRGIELVSSVDSESVLKLKVSIGSSASKLYMLRAGSGPGNLRSQDQKFDKLLDDILISGDIGDVSRIQGLFVLCRYELQQT